MLTSLRRTALPVLCILLASCATDPQRRGAEDERRIPDGMARLSTDSRLHLVSVDAVAPVAIASASPGSTYAIAPGIHTLKLTFKGTVYTMTDGKPTRGTGETMGEVPLSFEFRPARRYELHYQVLYERLSAQVVDVTDGYGLSGRAPNWGQTAGAGAP